MLPMNEMKTYKKFLILTHLAQWEKEEEEKKKNLSQPWQWITVKNKRIALKRSGIHLNDEDQLFNDTQKHTRVILEEKSWAAKMKMRKEGELTESERRIGSTNKITRLFIGECSVKSHIHTWSFVPRLCHARSVLFLAAEFFRLTFFHQSANFVSETQE